MNNTDKKVLIISHNPLSQVNNNGKTLVSIFEGIPRNNLYQIYLNSDIPDYSDECHYLQINEMQIIHSIFSGKNICCQEVVPNHTKISSATIKLGSFGIHTKRLLREMVWKASCWETKLKKWLQDKKFDVVFFMAGDGLFAYNVYYFVMKNISAKGCLFFTDDYIIGKNSNSPVALLRQQLLKRKIKKTLPIVSELFVISDEMREAYRKILHMDSHVIRNFSVEKKSGTDNSESKAKNIGLTMVYAGGLHYNRWKILSEIAHQLKKINENHELPCQLKIYSSQHISDEIIKKIHIEGASAFCGGAPASQIADIYASADILLHVESFDKRSIASTKYSFSTKIPEYLSADKCIAAVGPSEVASIRYLSDFACVVSDEEKIFDMLQKIVYDSKYRDDIRTSCKAYYEKDFSRKNQAECLNKILSV